MFWQQLFSFSPKQQLALDLRILFLKKKIFITFPSCSALLWENTIATTVSLTHEYAGSLHTNLPFLSTQPCWAESSICPGFGAGPSKKLEKQRAGCRAENRLCLSFFVLGRVKPVLPHKVSQECQAGQDLVQAVLLHHGRFLSCLKNSSAKTPHISPWELGPVFQAMLKALTWSYPVSRFARCFLFLPRQLPAQIFEDCLYHSLDRKATHMENLDLSPGPVLT